MKTALVARHIHFEDLGTLQPLLNQRGYETRTCDMGTQNLDRLEAKNADLFIVLGAPIGAYEEKAYPLLTQELQAIEQRLDDRRPLLGICLGAQLMAHVLGAPVASMGHKEIGFSPIELTAAGQKSPLSHLPTDTAVLHWHGDQFAIPNGLESLASTPLCPHQAFAAGKNALGLQFHLEADTNRIESWLIGHAGELAQAGIDPRTLRAEAKTHGARLRSAAQAVFGAWLDEVE